MKRHILVVEDDTNTREGIKQALVAVGYNVTCATNGQEALAALDAQVVNLVVSDIRMPHMDGMELLKEIQSQDPDIAVILLTAYGTVETAVEAMKQGAEDFITKPINLKELLSRIEKALSLKMLQQDYGQLKNQILEHYTFENIIGKSPQVQSIFSTIRQVAPSKVTVLITGESGTGKELVARAIHQRSPRRDRSFVPVHCAALAESLLESELFGHERGAFTGASALKKGRFEIAHEGTLFLDEISEIKPSIQVKLLRVLQEMKFERVGGNKTIPVDIRIVAATNRNLTKQITSGLFREDLYYRLNVVNIHIPPLRERPEDIEPLAYHFLGQATGSDKHDQQHITPQALQILQDYAWPGNVRELQNCVQSIVALTGKSTIEQQDLPMFFRQKINISQTEHTNKKTLNVKEGEEQLIKKALAQTKNNKTEAAKLLGISRRTLHRKLKTLNIDY